MSPIPEFVEIGESVIYQELRDEAVLLDMTSEVYYGLDDVGTVMWRLLLEHANVEAVVVRLVGIFDADEATIRDDAHKLVHELLSAKLLKAHNQSIAAEGIPA